MGFGIPIFPETLFYKPYCLKEVICGANMKLSTFIKLKKFIDKLPNANGISIFVATLSEINYELVIKRLDFNALQMINKNYFDLSSNDKELKRSFTYELKRTYGISEQNVGEKWKTALDNILIYRIISDFEFDKIDIAERIRRREMQEERVLLFMNSMANDIKYLEYRATRSKY